jgi:two-component system, sensor histidine kinase and response regulator
MLSYGHRARAPLPLALRLRCLLDTIGHDNATNRAILQHYLTRGGMHSGAAADGPSALALLGQAHQQGAPYDLVVLDLEMPGMDGLDMAQAIRADPALASTRLVLLASAVPRERGALARRGGRPCAHPCPPAWSDSAA